MMEEILLYFSILHHGDWKKIFQSIGSHESIDTEKKGMLLSVFKQKYFTLGSTDYPEDFKRMDRPPYVVYFEGNKNLLKGKLRIGLSGSKHGSSYGVKLTKMSCMELIIKEVTIVTMDDEGSNQHIIKEAINLKGNLIVILTSSIDLASEEIQKMKENYPIDKWLLLSEYPEKVHSTYENVIAQQRLFSSTAHGLVILECKTKSPVMVAVSHALNEGKEIFCFPFFAGYQSGCNFLIQQGAHLIESIEDVLEDYPVF